MNASLTTMAAASVMKPWPCNREAIMYASSGPSAASFSAGVTMPVQPSNSPAPHSVLDCPPEAEMVCLAVIAQQMYPNRSAPSAK